MITMKELLGDHNATECTQDQLINLKELLFRINRVRADWGKPMIVTSGLRNDADMERIYKSKNYPKKSRHLFGQACDIKDDGSLMSWLKEDNSARMKQYDLWGELGTNGWVHLQIVPMGSYDPKTDIRWFNP
jgi:uncharacterized protein YcbK (DUF882 family)